MTWIGNRWSVSLYDPATGLWRGVNNTGHPDLSSEFTTLHPIWTGQEVVFITTSRSATGNEFIAGAFYNPAQNTWRAIPANNASPSMAFIDAGAKLVWLNHKLFLAQHGMDWMTLQRFDPAANQWSEVYSNQTIFVASVGPVFAHGEGQEVVLWSSAFNPMGPAGTAFNPQTSTWRNLSKDGMAGGVMEWLFVQWTSAELFAGAKAVLQRFDVPSNSWKSLPTEGMPTLEQSSVRSLWTGERLVVANFNPNAANLTLEVNLGLYHPTRGAWQLASPPPLKAALSSNTLFSLGYDLVWNGDQVLLIVGSESPRPIQFLSYSPSLRLYLYQKQ